MPFLLFTYDYKRAAGLFLFLLLLYFLSKKTLNIEDNELNVNGKAICGNGLRHIWSHLWKRWRLFASYRKASRDSVKWDKRIFFGYHTRVNIHLSMRHWNRVVQWLFRWYTGPEGKLKQFIVFYAKLNEAAVHTHRMWMSMSVSVCVWMRETNETHAMRAREYVVGMCS